MGASPHQLLFYGSDRGKHAFRNEKFRFCLKDIQAQATHTVK